MDEQIFTYYADLPPAIHSFVVENADMSFTIMINARIGREQQLLAYKHELDHIKNGDLNKCVSADSIESDAHGYVSQ